MVVIVIVFVNNFVLLVIEDYYKKGKGINIDFIKINVVKELGLNVIVYFEGSMVIIEFDKG